MEYKCVSVILIILHIATPLVGAFSLRTVKNLSSQGIRQRKERQPPRAVLLMNRRRYITDDDNDNSEFYYDAISTDRFYRQERPISDASLPLSPLIPPPPLAVPQTRQRRPSSNMLDRDYFDYDEEEEEYDVVDDDDSGYYDDDKGELRDDASTTQTPFPGNFWVNPISDDELRMQQSQNRRDRTGRVPPQAQSAQSSRRGRRSTNSRFSGSIGNTQQQPPSPFLDLYQRLFWYGLDENDALEDEDNDSDRRTTMFGGTKGKFNGLSFLYDSIGTVPLDEQRPKRSPRRDRRMEDTTTSIDVENGSNDMYYDVYEDDADENKAASDFRRPERQAQLRKTFVPVTPPYDPPQVPRSSKRISSNDYEIQSRRPRTLRSDRQRRTERSIGSNDWVVRTVDSWFASSEENTSNIDDADGDIMAPDFRALEPRAARSRYRSKMKSDEAMADAPVASIIQPITNAFETFLGLDRDVLQQEAVMYNMQMGLATSYKNKARTANSNSGAGLPTSQQSPHSVVTGNRMDLQNSRSTFNSQNEDSDRTTSIDPQTVDIKNSTGDKSIQESSQRQAPHTGLNDYLESSSSTDASTMWSESEESPELDIQNANGDTIMDINDNLDTESQNVKVKPLSWEERASAMERVPPLGVTAWGVNGVIVGCDARIKAFQDAIFDVQLMQNQIKNCQRQISSLQDEMSLLHMEAKLSKHQVQKMKQRAEKQEVRQRNGESTFSILKTLTDQIRHIENQLNNKNHEIRYKMLQKRNMVREYHVLMKRRHWAIFQTMKRLTTDESILSDPTNEALHELEMNEAAVRRFSMKQRKDSQ